MHTPIINIQEVHELARRLPESRGKAQLMAVKLPYPKQRLIFKHGTLIYLIELVRFIDGFVTFNGDAVNEELKIGAAIYLFIDKTKVRYIGYVMLFNNTEFGDHAKPRVHYTPPEGIPEHIQAPFRKAFDPYIALAVSNTLFALKLMQCNNISYVDYDPNKSLPWFKRKKGERKPKLPFVKYKILQIEPFKQRQQAINRPTAGAENEKRLHTVRGHFKTFTADRPLFGRLVGTYWWGDCVKGNPAFGLIEKDYEIKISTNSLKKAGGALICSNMTDL